MYHYPDGYEESGEGTVDPVTGYSKLMARLREVFYQCASTGDSYLLVYRYSLDQETRYRTVKKGEYPWNVHDRHMATTTPRDPCDLLMALDLQQAFEVQLPDFARSFEALDYFGFKPLINMPDRTGSVPEQRIRTALADIFQPRPELRVHTNREPVQRDPSAPKPALRLV